MAPRTTNPPLASPVTIPPGLRVPSPRAVRDQPMDTYRIPFNRPSVVGREYAYITESVATGQISGDGFYSKQCHKLLEEALGVKRALLTTSCTHALEMAALLLDVQPGDEVIVPSFTFVSTANAFALRGAKIVFADVRADTLNLDETKLEPLITPRTRAIVPVHYAGVGCEMDAVMDIARRHGIAVVEDNAHGLFGAYKDRPLGTFGPLAAQSFHETKNFICGEGGALLVNDPQYVANAEIIREKGTNRSAFFRGEIDKYTWRGLGSSYLLSDVLAAFLFGQLERREHIQGERRRVWERYDRELRGWCERWGVRRPIVPAHCEQAHHMYYLLMPDGAARARLIAHLKQRSILAVFHYVPLHLSDMGKGYGARPGDCPVTEDVSERLVRLPFYTSMTDAEQMQVIEAVAALDLS